MGYQQVETKIYHFLVLYWRTCRKHFPKLSNKCFDISLRWSLFFLLFRYWLTCNFIITYIQPLLRPFLSVTLCQQLVLSFLASWCFKEPTVCTTSKPSRNTKHYTQLCIWCKDTWILVCLSFVRSAKGTPVFGEVFVEQPQLHQVCLF